MTVISKPILCMACKGYCIAGMFTGGEFDESFAIRRTETIQISSYN